MDIDVKMDVRFKDFQENFKSNMRTELYSLLEQILGAVKNPSCCWFKAEQRQGNLREPSLGFPPKEAIILSPLSDLRAYSRVSSMETGTK